MSSLARAGSPETKVVRCAIYTRKSTDDGLDQEFNSLDAQRQACEAFVVSQRGEGWRLIEDRYDDGGCSGGDMRRPALIRLLSDVSRRKVDLILIYKVDRLTRSLRDFAVIMDVLEKAHCSFASITQSLNTQTSMGRLTLNMLLSFAQFERELGSERVRDKIAASKAKGLWTGGGVPLGYDLVDRKLVVNESEARLVRHIMRTYVELGTMRALMATLRAEGVVTKRSKSGRGGIPFKQGALYHFLRNKLYLGLTKHKGATYPGQHTAIVSQRLWDDVQRQLQENSRERRLGAHAKHGSMLAGFIFDAAGRRLGPSHTRKSTRRYRYYATVPDSETSTRSRALRLRAEATERAVRELLASYFADHVSRVEEWCEQGASIEQQEVWTQRYRETAELLASGRLVAVRQLLIDAQCRVIATASSLEVSLNKKVVWTLVGGGSAEALKAADEGIRLRTFVNLQTKKRPGNMLIKRSGERVPRQPDQPLKGLLVQAFAARSIVFGECPDVALSHRQDVALQRLAKLSFLAPDIVEGIFEGTQPRTLTARKLRGLTHLPASWPAQRQLLGWESGCTTTRRMLATGR